MAFADRKNQNKAVVVGKLIGGSGAPAIAAGTGAGTGPTIAIAGNDMAGTITVTTGSSPAASNATIATVTFSAPYDNIPRVEITPANAAAAALTGATSCFADQSQVTAALFKLIAGSTALTGATAYVFNYTVTG